MTPFNHLIKVLSYRLKGYDLKNYRQFLLDSGFHLNEIRPEIKRRLFQIKDDSKKEANTKMVSFAFVRDPFDRIVSCFHSKMVRKDWLEIEHSQQLRWMRDEILEK